MTISSSPLILSHFTVTTAAGCGNQENLDALKNGSTGLRKNNFLDAELDTWIGRVEGIEEQNLPNDLTNYQCRNNQLAYLALQQDDFSLAINNAKQNYGAHRVGIFLGTSTSGILSTELIYQTELFQSTGILPGSSHFREQHNSFSVAEFVRNLYQLKGPAQVVSTACSSSAKVFASAARYIELGLCDAAIVGGVDSLCLTTLYGFNSLELVAPDICRPADKNRNGLSIGEGAAFILLEKAERQPDQQSPVYLRGYGESSDAYHMSSPHPEGRGAFQAMQQAIERSEINSSDIDYVNLHGTATPVNDQMEDKALAQVFSLPVACSSTKGWTGHTLGAAGGVEAIYSTLCIQHNFMPQSLNTLTPDPTFTQPILEKTLSSSVHTVASNSFGFGGNNCCLILGDNIC
ncbi:MAG: beta-ketoacyl-[acyl-carrier-protein] synthase family protein [Gammaproteobacteria bacterium]|nr:beta-ketoacyl-[acyl-carrier-protein] synthase family protein [Gammaproteobacteria bacterium]